MKTFLIDPSHSQLSFSVKHLLISKVRGSFQNTTGTLLLDEESLENSQVNVTVDVSTLNTKDSSRDTYLISPEFFDVDNFPRFTFQSKRYGHKSVSGELTIRGITRPLVLTIDGPDRHFKVTGHGKIHRKDFGLIWNAALEAGGMLVGDEIGITFDVQLVKQD